MTLSFVFEPTVDSRGRMDLEIADVDIKMRPRRDPKTGAHL
jgi:hypothetical protein